VENLPGPRTSSAPTPPSAATRPIIETEDFRNEGSRRMWDAFSRPSTRPKGPNDTWKRDGFLYNSEDFTSTASSSTTPTGSTASPTQTPPTPAGPPTAPSTSRRGRRRPPGLHRGLRVSGKVDAMRLPKEIYFAHRVIPEPQPDLHILGHWTYPATSRWLRNRQDVYVIANTSRSSSSSTESPSASTPSRQQLDLRLPRGRLRPGSIKAIGKNGDKIVAQQEITTAGPAVAIRLTPPSARMASRPTEKTSPSSTSKSSTPRRALPTDYAASTSPAPAPPSGAADTTAASSIPQQHVPQHECGINRVAVRSKLIRTTIRSGPSPSPQTRRPQVRADRLHSHSRRPRHGIAAAMPQHPKAPRKTNPPRSPSVPNNNSGAPSIPRPLRNGWVYGCRVPHSCAFYAHEWDSQPRNNPSRGHSGEVIRKSSFWRSQNLRIGLCLFLLVILAQPESPYLSCLA